MTGPKIMARDECLYLVVLVAMNRNLWKGQKFCPFSAVFLLGVEFGMRRARTEINFLRLRIDEKRLG